MNVDNFQVIKLEPLDPAPILSINKGRIMEKSIWELSRIGAGLTGFFEL